VIAPASPFDRPSFEKGLGLIAGRYQPVVTPGLFASTRYLAGDDARRLAELRGAFRHDAVFSARGGYGVMRLLGEFDLAEIPSQPLIGFSDLTALHAAYAVAGHKSLHGPVLTQLATQPAEVVDRLFALLESPALPAPLQGQGQGTADGPLLGGNLSVLTRLIGTRFMPPLEGAVLLLEDVGEKPYRLDRMLTHLKLAGLLDAIAGFALGQWTGCDEKDSGYTALDVVLERVAKTGKPFAHSLPIGHGAANQPVALGARVRIAQGRLEFLEPLVAP
jgi:muramoyltetrapeptide carboxypeptidase